MKNFDLLKSKTIFSLILIFCNGVNFQTAAQKTRKTVAVSDVRFDAGDSAVGVPFDFYNNHIYLQVKINNSELLTFILDTGASSIISRRVAESLKLEFRGTEKGFGAGQNAVEASTAEGVFLSLSGLTVSKQNIAVVSLEDLQKSLGRKVDGILGYGFLSRLVIEIDYAAQKINIYAPGSFRYKGKGECIPLIVDADSGLIFARAAIKLLNRPIINGLFEIDSGGGHTLILNSPFVKRNKLLAENQKSAAVSVGSLGGSSRVVPETIEALQIGRNNSLKNITALFSLATEGMLANEEFAGNIGNDFLRHYKVVFDYSRHSMYLESVK